jgi:hypothetical protein
MKKNAFYINSVLWNSFQHQMKFSSDCIDTILMKDIPLYLETINEIIKLNCIYCITLAC